MLILILCNNNINQEYKFNNRIFPVKNNLTIDQADKKINRTTDYKVVTPAQITTSQTGSHISGTSSFQGSHSYFCYFPELGETFICNQTHIINNSYSANLQKLPNPVPNPNPYFLAYNVIQGEVIGTCSGTYIIEGGGFVSTFPFSGPIIGDARPSAYNVGVLNSTHLQVSIPGPFDCEAGLGSFGTYQENNGIITGSGGRSQSGSSPSGGHSTSSEQWSVVLETDRIILNVEVDKPEINPYPGNGDPNEPKTQIKITTKKSNGNSSSIYGCYYTSLFVSW